MCWLAGRLREGRGAKATRLMVSSPARPAGRHTFGARGNGAVHPESSPGWRKERADWGGLSYPPVPCHHPVTVCSRE